MTDKKNLLMLLLAKKKPGEPTNEPSAEPEQEGSAHDDALKAAMEDFLKAVSARDPEQMAQAFTDALDCHEGYEQDEQEPNKDDSSY